MVNTDLSQLPPELTNSILILLPISSLLAFAQTSKSNYNLAAEALCHLELAVFPKSMNARLAFLEEEGREYSCDDDDDEYDIDRAEADGDWSLLNPFENVRRRYDPMIKRTRLNAKLYQIERHTQPTVSPPASPSNLISGNDGKQAYYRSTSPNKASPTAIRAAEIATQNGFISHILSSRTLRDHLKSLTLHTYTLHTQSMADTISSMLSLQHLNLNFTHSYIYDTTLPANYWRTTPGQGSGSPVWNALAGVGTEASLTLKLRNLHSLTLRRAGITSFQLRSWIKSNPQLREIQFEKVRGVDLEFVNWLAEYIVSQRQNGNEDRMIDRISLRDCSELVCRQVEHFTWIDVLSRSRPFSALGCRLTLLDVKDSKSVDDDLFCKLAGWDMATSPNVVSTTSSALERGPGQEQIHINPNHGGNHTSSVEAGSSTRQDCHFHSHHHQTLSQPRNQWTTSIRKLISPKGTPITRLQDIRNARNNQIQSHQDRSSTSITTNTRTGTSHRTGPETRNTTVPDNSTTSPNEDIPDPSMTSSVASSIANPSASNGVVVTTRWNEVIEVDPDLM